MMLPGWRMAAAQSIMKTSSGWAGTRTQEMFPISPFLWAGWGPTPFSSCPALLRGVSCPNMGNCKGKSAGGMATLCSPPARALGAAAPWTLLQASRSHCGDSCILTPRGKHLVSLKAARGWSVHRLGGMLVPAGNQDDPTGATK